MWKILIVDDDILTRKGIQILMPWEKYEMEIVGEASNGQKALDFLASNPVDLVLVDVDMPVMDGFTFVEKSKELYPELKYVVLTIHTEFEYIQRFLRMGVIDYISKEQFDQENFNLILERIRAGMTSSTDFNQAGGVSWKGKEILHPQIYALITLESVDEDFISCFWELNQLSPLTNGYEVMAGVWVFAEEREPFIFPEEFTNTTLLCISDVRGMTYKQLGKLLRNYRLEQFFYDYQPIAKVNYKRVFELQENKYIEDEDTFKKIKEEWLSLNWVCDKEIFDKIKFDLKQSKLSFSKLYHILLSLENAWNTNYGSVSGERIEIPPSFQHWLEVEEWIMDIYDKSSFAQPDNKYSPEIVKNIYHAKHFIDTNYGSPLEIAQIARTVHLSNGYFSKCFHDIVGAPFREYCISVRVKQAKEMLRQTSDSIGEIAYKVGYSDEKYFSRIFKKVTGSNPTTYRKEKGGFL